MNKFIRIFGILTLLVLAGAAAAFAQNPGIAGTNQKVISREIKSSTSSVAEIPERSIRDEAEISAERFPQKSIDLNSSSDMPGRSLDTQKKSQPKKSLQIKSEASSSAGKTIIQRSISVKPKKDKEKNKDHLMAWSERGIKMNIRSDISVGSVHLYNKHWTLFIVVVLQLLIFIGYLASSGSASAQDQAKAINKQYKLPSNIKKYLSDKYIEIRDVTSTLQETPHGPRGSIGISGNFVPKSVITEANKHDRLRAIAKSFIAEEPELFGITDLEELREYKFESAESGWTHIYYSRFIGDLQFESSIFVHINPEEQITSISGSVTPALPELYEAATKKTLLKDEIVKIIEQNFKSTGLDPKNMRILRVQKFAVSYSPYVVWGANVNLKHGSGSWGYEIDAFTGEILKKKEALIHK